MGCDIKRDANGQMTSIVCSRGQRRCRWCGKPCTKLCDFPRDAGTCDAPMCDSHAKHVAYETDYCPDHQERRAKS